MPLLSKLVAAFRSPNKPPHLPEPLYPEATTELAMLSRLVADPALNETFGALGLQQPDLQSLLSTQIVQDRQRSEQALRQVRAGALSAAAGAHGALSTKRLPQEDLLAFLVTLGSDEIREVIGRFGVAPGAIAFWLAHREHEVALRSNWPSTYPNGARVAVVNDPYSPMEVVLRCLTKAFRLPHEKAVALMLRIHQEGLIHLDFPTSATVVTFCDDWNRQWRSVPVPLYMRPLAV